MRICQMSMFDPSALFSMFDPSALFSMFDPSALFRASLRKNQILAN